MSIRFPRNAPSPCNTNPSFSAYRKSPLYTKHTELYLAQRAEVFKGTPEDAFATSVLSTLTHEQQMSLFKTMVSSKKFGTPTTTGYYYCKECNVHRFVDLTREYHSEIGFIHCMMCKVSVCYKCHANASDFHGMSCEDCGDDFCDKCISENPDSFVIHADEDDGGLTLKKCPTTYS